MFHFVKTVRIRRFSGPIFLAFGLNIAGKMWENAGQKNPEYGHFSRNVCQLPLIAKQGRFQKADKHLRRNLFRKS